MLDPRYESDANKINEVQKAEEERVQVNFTVLTCSNTGLVRGLV